MLLVEKDKVQPDGGEPREVEGPPSAMHNCHGCSRKAFLEPLKEIASKGWSFQDLPVLN